MKFPLLFCAVAALIAFAFVEAPEKDGGNVIAARSASASRTESPQTPAESLELPDQRGLGRARGELFGSPPPPPPASPPSPAPVVYAPTPTAPPVPYRFAGKIRAGAEEEILLARGRAIVPIREGDTLDGVYRVESIGADRIDLVYLPLGTKDRILVSSALEPDRRFTPVATALLAPTSTAEATPALPHVRPAQFRWDGPQRVRAGASFSVALRVSYDQPLRAAPMQLRFDAGALEPLGVRPGKFLGQGSFTYRVGTDGSIFVGASTPEAAPGADAELLVVTFRPIRSGTTELSMGALSLQGAAGRAVAHQQPAAFRTAVH